MHKITFALLFTFITTLGYSQADLIKIKSEHLQESNYLKMDDFYLTHHLYIDLFLRESLFPDAAVEDVSTILKAIKKYVSPESPLEIEVEKPGKRNYIIKMAILKNEGKPEILVAFTNWSANKKVFEKEIKFENDSYTRWYFLNDDKMTYRKDVSSENDYTTMSKPDLANAYLFDELTENDVQIKTIIDETLEDEKLEFKDQVMAHLVLLKYYILLKENDKVAEQTNYLNKLFETNAYRSDLRGLEMAFNATKFQIELMKE